MKVRSALPATATAAALVLALASSAGAAPPDPKGQGVALTEPGVVFIITDATVDVRLDAADPTSPTGKAVFRGSYKTTLGTGSGFVVTPEGSIVTAAHVVDVEEEGDQRIRNWAANQMFFVDPETSSGDYVLEKTDDPYSQFNLTDNAFLDGLLQGCYTGDICTFEVTPRYRVITGAQIAGEAVSKGQAAQLRTSTGFDGTDIAVLQVPGTNMPTVPLGTTAAGLQNSDPLVALGFPGSNTRLPRGMTEPNNDDGNVSAVTVVNGTKQIAVNNLTAEAGMSGGPAIGADGKVIGLVSWGLLRDDDGTDAKIYLRTIDDINTALATAGVKPARGATDEAYEKGMRLFWDEHYSAALPELQRAVTLYDGHPNAKTTMAAAQAKAGTPEDKPLPAAAPAAAQDDGGSPVVPIALGALLLLGLVGVGAALAARRRSSSRAAFDIAPSPAPFVPAQGGAPAVDGTSAGWQQAPALPAAGPTGTGAALQVQQTPAPPVARFCSSCGQQQDGGRFCSGCGTPT